MADDILAHHCNPPPPIDTVLLWLSATVERDLEARSALPHLRQAPAQAHRGSTSLHYLNEEQAEAVLADALCREQEVSKGLRTAYRAHIRSVQGALSEAAERPALFASPEVVCVYRSESSERWRGTKDQLEAHGIRLDGPWPHEPGGRNRWAQALDSSGYKANITRYSSIWPGLYEARVTIPYEVWGAKQSDATKVDAAKQAKRSLASMPRSADDYRAHLVDSMRMMIRVVLDMAIKPSSCHGYMLNEDDVGEIHASFDAVVEAVAGARVKFDSALHGEIAQEYRAQIAASDQAFQAHFETLVRPNPRILEGGVQ